MITDVLITYQRNEPERRIGFHYRFIELDRVTMLVDGLAPSGAWMSWAARRSLACVVMRWMIDGMNVIGTRPDAWWRDRHAAMIRLVGQLERWVAATGEDVIVVFEQPPRPPITSTVIQVKHAPRAGRDSADDEIIRLLTAEPQPSGVRVVSSDHWLSDRVHALGATVESSEPFRRRLEE